MCMHSFFLSLSLSPRNSCIGTRSRENVQIHFTLWYFPVKKALKHHALYLIWRFQLSIQEKSDELLCHFCSSEFIVTNWRKGHVNSQTLICLSGLTGFFWHCSYLLEFSCLSSFLYQALSPSHPEQAFLENQCKWIKINKIFVPLPCKLFEWTIGKMQRTVFDALCKFGLQTIYDKFLP